MIRYVLVYSKNKGESVMRQYTDLHLAQRKLYELRLKGYNASIYKRTKTELKKIL